MQQLPKSADHSTHPRHGSQHPVDKSTGGTAAPGSVLDGSATPPPFLGASSERQATDAAVAAVVAHWSEPSPGQRSAHPEAGRSAATGLTAPAFAGNPDADAAWDFERPWRALAGGHAESRHPHALAASGVASACMGLPYGDIIQAAFGRHDISGIKSQVGGAATAAAAGLDAEAYAFGSCIAFAKAPSLFLAAHEAAHFIQQRAGVSLPGDMGSVGDTYECHANEVASAVVAGLSAEPLLDRLAGSGTGTTPTRAAVQCFATPEHVRIGNNASRDKHGKIQMVELVSGYSIPYGAMVAMAGDFFGSIDEMRRLAAVPGPGADTREELEYVLHVKLEEEGRTAGGSPQKAGASFHYSEAAKAAVDVRYYKLAANNRVHFPNARSGKKSIAELAAAAPDPEHDLVFNGIHLPPELNNAVEGYRYYHVRAIIEAAKAGAAKGGVDSAMATEAFGAHFLSDSFAGGHLRTERQSIKEYWNAQVPMFFYNLKGWMAEEIAKRVAAGIGFWGFQLREDIAYDPPVSSGAKDKVTSKLDAIGPLGFGDLVSGAIHDYDNAHGVMATVAGKTAKLFGDDHAGQGDEERLATKAVALGRIEILTAFSMGASGSESKAVIHKLLGKDKLFAPERMIPRAKPDAQQDAEHKKIQWRYPNYEALLNDPQFAQGAVIFANAQAATIKKLTAEFSASQQKAIEDGVIDKLRTCPLSTVRTIIDWTPTITDSALGHNTDDHANDYWQEAKKTPGGLKSLTYIQRERLILHLLDGATVGNDEDAILDILKSAPAADVRRLIGRFGWQTLYDKIDDGPGEQFKESFPESIYGQ